MKERMEEKLKEFEFEKNMLILDELIKRELNNCAQKTRFYLSKKLKYVGDESNLEEFILFYAKAKGYEFENTGQQGIYSIKIFVPLSDKQALEVKFFGKRGHGQGNMSLQFDLTKFQKVKE